MKRIHDSLARVFQSHRLVFWYDPTQEWEETFRAYPDQAVAKLAVEASLPRQQRCPLNDLAQSTRRAAGPMNELVEKLRARGSRGGKHVKQIQGDNFMKIEHACKVLFQTRHVTKKSLKIHEYVITRIET